MGQRKRRLSAAFLQGNLPRTSGPKWIPSVFKAGGEDGCPWLPQLLLLSIALLDIDDVEPLADARRLAGAAAQVIELRAPHVAAPFDLDAGDQRRVGLEGPFHALA